MVEIVEQLKTTHQSEKDYHQISIKSLTKESALLTKRLDVLLDEYLDKSITKDMYDRKHGQLIERRHEINKLLERHHADDEQFRIAVITLVTLASKAAEIFESSTTDEKRQLIRYLFSNLELGGSNLRYTLNIPFNLFVNSDGCKEWLPGTDSNRRPSD